MTAVTRRRLQRQAFSLIELLLVLVILAILAGVIVPKFTNRTEQAKVTAAKTDVSFLETQLDAFEIDNGRFPSTEEGLQALVTQPSNATEWKGPYIKRGVPKDPWGSEYLYRYPGANNANGYDLSSFGPDGREGNDDVNNWSKQ